MLIHRRKNSCFPSLSKRINPPEKKPRLQVMLTDQILFPALGGEAAVHSENVCGSSVRRHVLALSQHSRHHPITSTLCKGCQWPPRPVPQHITDTLCVHSLTDPRTTASHACLHTHKYIHSHLQPLTLMYPLTYSYAHNTPTYTYTSKDYTLKHIHSHTQSLRNTHTGQLPAPSFVLLYPWC